MRIPAVLLLLIALLAFSTSARAAESYANCTGIVSKLPATISTSGTWCLEKSFTTANVTIKAITIAADNVTLDCNDFVLSGTAGAASANVGVYSLDHLNTTIRHCNLQGFRYGVYLTTTGVG